MNSNVKEKSWPLMVTLLISIIVIVAIVSYSTYAYYTTSVGGDHAKNTETINTSKIETTLVEGDLVGGNLIPGDSVSKTFSIKNVGTGALTYNLFLKDIVNNFVNKNDLRITVKENGTTILSDYTFPNTSVDPIKIKTGLNIASKATNNYEVIITYMNSTSDQSADIGKTFSTKIGIN